MPGTVLSFFGATVYKPVSTSPPTRVPVPFAKVDVYREGATLTSDVRIPAPPMQVDLTVDSPGALTSGSLVTVGINGNPLQIVSVNGTQVRAVGLGTPEFLATAGTRLILTGDRPDLFFDPAGTVPTPTANFVYADVNGEFGVYAADARLDYVASAVPLAAGNTTISTLSAAQSNLQWDHVVEPRAALLLVAVAWQDSLGEEMVTGVSLGSQLLAPLSSGGGLDVYYLLHPSVGPQSVTVTWSGGNPKGAVASAETFLGADAYASALGTVAAADGGPNSDPSVAVTPQATGSGLWSAVAVFDQSTTTTLTATTGQQLTNGQGGSSAATDLTQGGTAILYTPSSPQTMSWHLNPQSSRTWRILAAEIKAMSFASFLEALTGEPLPMKGYCVTDFATVQEAIDATPSGGTLYFPPGEYNVPDDIGSSGWRITRPITLQGAGKGNSNGYGFSNGYGTVLTPWKSVETAENNVCIHVDHAGGVIIRDMTIANRDAPGSSGVGHGIWVDNHYGDSDPYPHAITDFQVRDVDIYKMGGDGIFIDGEVTLGGLHPSGGDGSVNAIWIENVHAALNNGYGVRMIAIVAPTLHNVVGSANGLNGLYARYSTGIRVIGNYYEANCVRGTDAHWNSQARLSGCHGAVVLGTHFEEFELHSPCFKALVLENCFGVQVSGCNFLNANQVAGTISIWLVTQCAGTVLGANTHRNVNFALYAEDDATGTVVLPQVVFPFGPGQQGANTPGYVRLPATVPNFNLDLAVTQSYQANRIVGLKLPVLASMSDVVDAASEGVLTYDHQAGRLHVYANANNVLTWKTVAFESGFINAREYSSIAAAVSALPSTGGVVYIPEGVYDTSTTPSFTPGLSLPSDRPVTLLGAGPNATVLAGSTIDGDLITMPGDYQALQGMTLDGRGTNTGTGRGVVVGAANRGLRRARIVDCVIRNTSAWAIHILGTGDATNAFAIECSVLRTECQLTKNPAFGAAKVGIGCTTIYLQESSFENSAGYLVKIDGADGVEITKCVLEKSSAITDDSQPFLHLNGAHQCAVDECWFEATTESQTYPFIAMDGVGRCHTISACAFRRSSTNPRILSINASTPSVVVLNPDIVVLDPPAASDHFFVNGPETEFILIGGKIVTSVGYYQPKVQFAIGAGLIQSGDYPHLTIAGANALSTRVPTVPATTVASPAIGDLIFDPSTNRGRMYDGATWRDLW